MTFSVVPVNGELVSYVEETIDEVTGVLLPHDVEEGVINEEVEGTGAASRGDSLSSRFCPKKTEFKSALPNCGCNVN